MAAANGKQPGIGGAPTGKTPDAAGPPKPPAGGWSAPLPMPMPMPMAGKPIARRNTSGAQYGVPAAKKGAKPPKRFGK